MVQRIITKLETTITADSDGFVLWVMTTYVESSLGGGRIQKQTDRYDRLSVDELTDLLDDVTEGRFPGEPLPEHEGLLAFI